MNMRIEDEIQQPNFENEKHKATVNLMYTNNWIVTKIKGSLKTHEITLQQYNVLRILRGSHPKPISTASIRNRMLDKMSDASRIVDRLVKKDLVKRSTCSGDKRLVDVLISEKGLYLLDDIDQDTNEMTELLENLTEKEAITLNGLLDKIRN
jgi:DNA-binding MarR family transcriptional regulator